MIQVTKDVFCVGGSSLSDSTDAAIYLLRSNREAALVDAGTGRQHAKVIANVKKTGIDPQQVRLIFLTHCHYDHTGGAELLRQATGAQLIAHRADAQFLIDGDSEVTAAIWYSNQMTPLPVDTVIDEKEKRFLVGDIEVTLYHVPGHSPGSVVLTATSENKLVLFGQDIHGPLHPVLKSNRDDYRRSLEFLLSLQADILCEGHFGVFYGKDEVADFIESYL
jgi:glyoxylase-like metal-dependent hydrolase (beta-lactamase superfamily II)